MPSRASQKWKKGQIACFTHGEDDECLKQEVEIFSGETIDSPELRDKLIKLRFILPSRERQRGIQRVTECYNIDDLFYWVFQQIYESKDPVVTPTRKALTSSQISRIHRCYFGQPDSARKWTDLDAFNAELERLAQDRDLRERQELMARYAPEGFDLEDLDDDGDGDGGDGDDDNDSEDMLMIQVGINWLLGQFPELLVEDPLLVLEIYDQMMHWLGVEGLLRWDRYTLGEILANNTAEIREYLENTFADLEQDMPPVTFL